MTLCKKKETTSSKRTQEEQRGAERGGEGSLEAGTQASRVVPALLCAFRLPPLRHTHSPTVHSSFSLARSVSLIILLSVSLTHAFSLHGECFAC